MKPGSLLNPYAASYTPLSKRGIVDEKDSNTGKQPAWLGHHPGPGVIAPSPYQQFPQNFDATQQFPGNSRLKVPNVYVSQGSSSQIRNEITGKQAMDDDFDVDLAFLQMAFPGISDDSLSDVYIANSGDLQATVDMINDLEECTEDSLGLPETLDIGDVPESGFFSEPPYQKKKVASAETSSSSGS